MALGTTIPANLIKQLIPVLMKQVELLSSAAENLIKDTQALPDNVKCDDPRIVSAKQKLDQIYKLIDEIKKGLNLINQIVPIINTVSTVASTLSFIQLAIPAVPGVPTGPIAKLITTFDNLGKNAKSSVNSLKGLISTININFARTNQLLSKVVSKLSSICNGETFNVSGDIQAALDDSQSSNNRLTSSSNNRLASSLSNEALASKYPSLFYREINVSDDDIQGRFDTIRNLLQNQLNVLQNLKEAPSKILSGNSTPNLDTGDIDDYFIDVDSQIIYGPKTSNGWGTGIGI